MTLQEWVFRVLWPFFGKCVLVVVYTHAWLMYGRQAAVSWWVDPAIWRWINIFTCLAIYTWHLLVKPDDQSSELHDA